MDSEKFIVSFTSEAEKVGEGVLIQSNGVALSSDNAIDSPVLLQTGKKYKITIEELE